MTYKVLAYSMFVKPQEYFVETKDEAQELRDELKNQQYSVDIEEINED